MLLVPTVLTAVMLTSSPTASLEKALGWTLPRWGTTSAQFQQAFPALQEHQPHWCPNETSTATVRELRRPNLEIAGEQVEFIDLQVGSQGLESVSFDLGLGRWHLTHAGQAPWNSVGPRLPYTDN